jgi:hypothetical protein
MIIKRDENKGFADLPDPEAGKMMEISRPIESKGGHLASNFFPKRVDESSGSAIAELRTPTAAILDWRDRSCSGRPRAVKVDDLAIHHSRLRLE